MIRIILPICVLLSLASFVRADDGVLRKPVTWTDRVVTVSEPVRISYGGFLTVAAGTEVRFTGEGRIECTGGSFRATGALFRADSRIDGSARLRFNRARTVVFEDCTLEGITAVNSSSHHECSIYCLYTNLVLHRCTLADSVSVAVFHTTAPEITMNRFVHPVDHALVVSHTDRARISQNTFEAREGGSCGLYLKAAKNCAVTENRFFGNGKGVGACLRYDAHHNSLLANAFFGCRTGIVLQDGCWANVMVGNLICRPKYFGFRIRESGPDNVVANCVVWEAGYAGLCFEHMKASAAVRNCVFASGERGLWLPSEKLPKLSRNCFWANRKSPPDKIRAVIDAGDSLLCDPLFVDPTHGNFRLQTEVFGSPEDSPLLGAGTPEGISIGLYPHHPAGQTEQAE